MTNVTYIKKLDKEAVKRINDLLNDELNELNELDDEMLKSVELNDDELQDLYLSTENTRTLYEDFLDNKSHEELEKELDELENYDKYDEYKEEDNYSLNDFEELDKSKIIKELESIRTLAIYHDIETKGFMKKLDDRIKFVKSL